VGGRAGYGLLLDVVDISEMQKCRLKYVMQIIRRQLRTATKTLAFYIHDQIRKKAGSQSSLL